MTELWEIAGGSVRGRNHTLTGWQNQDAYYWQETKDGIVAVVCDGCGSCPHSEVGAKIGARLVTKEIISKISNSTITLTWDEIKQNILIALETLTKIISETPRKIMHDYFLFTIVGAVITNLETTVFSLGDGVFALNDTLNPIGPFGRNEPPYLAYNAWTTKEYQQRFLDFQIHEVIPTCELKSVLIGTDGMLDFINAEQKTMPGKEELVGSLKQFWEDDRYFKNSDMIRRKLALTNRDCIKPDWKGCFLHREVGLLPDDTTLVVIRRRRG